MISSKAASLKLQLHDEWSKVPQLQYTFNAEAEIRVMDIHKVFDSLEGCETVVFECSGDGLSIYGAYEENPNPHVLDERDLVKFSTRETVKSAYHYETLRRVVDALSDYTSTITLKLDTNKPVKLFSPLTMHRRVIGVFKFYLAPRVEE